MKKTLALLLTLAMVFSMVLPVGAFGFETVETVTEELPAAVQSEPEAAALAAEVIPGKNLLTGKSGVMTFDDATEADLLIGVDNFASKTIVEKPTSLVDESALDADGTYGKILQFHRGPVGRHWSNLKFNHTFDGTRKFWFTWDHYFDMADVKTHWGAAIWFIPAAEGNHMSFDTTPNKWTHTSKTGTPLNGKSFDWQFRMGIVAEENGACANPLNFYIDNFGVFPFYKINYVMPDGTAVTEDFLFADGVEWKAENIATEYTVKTDNRPAEFSTAGVIYKAIGWSTEINSDTVMETIPLNGEDLTLYPVYEKTAFLDSDNFVIAATEVAEKPAPTSTTITAKEAVSWAYDLGTTEAAVETTETTAVITANGKAGTVKLTATPASDPSISYEVEVDIIGSKEWKPGLNVLTGSEKALNFENASASVYKYVFDDGGEIRENPTKAGINTTDNALYVTDNSFGVAFGMYINPMEVERPLYISYDYIGKFGAHWFMANGSGSGDNVFWNVKDSGYDSTDTWKHVFAYRTANDACKALCKNEGFTRFGLEVGTSNNPYLYADNIKFIPAYKITYLNFDGSVAKTEYLLCDENGSFITEYIPDSSVVDGAKGYSTEPDGAKVVKIKFNHEDITLYPMKEAPISFVDGDTVVNEKTDYTQDYTIPSPESLGMTIENFVCWLTDDGIDLYPGDVIAVKNIDSIKGKTITAYCQDLTLPAAALSYEGDKNCDGTGKYKYSELVEDEGRTALHLRQFETSYNGNGNWMTDTRSHYRVQEGFDASEYGIFQLSYKIASAKNVKTGTTPENVTEDALYEHTKPAFCGFIYYGPNTFYGGSNGLMYIGNNGGLPLIYDNEYHTFEIDQSLPENNKPSTPWTSGEGGKIYGFALDLVLCNYSSDVYVDSVRVYRKGVFTVTYDTNAPAGYEDMVQTEVDPDTGRGGGTNYPLKGDRPEISTLTFRGWALKPDATPEETIDVIENFNRSTTVYAVWSNAPASPKTDKNNINIRSGADNVNGIRFSASVANRNKAMLEEYGFIIAREDILGSNELTFLLKKEDENKPLYVYGAAYDKKTGLDLQYDVNGSNIIFTAVCTNIPAEHYATRLVARTYAKYAVSGHAFTVYGDSVVKSIKEVAQSIKDAGGTAYEDNKDYIDSILAA